MRYLLISSCLVLVVSCASYPKKQGFEKQSVTTANLQNPYFSNPNQDYVYKANIEVYDKTFGGIFIVKKLADQNHRVVFTTEMGNKLFDFSFANNDFKVNYIIDELNKKILINILKKDFKVLISNPLEIVSGYQSNNHEIFEAKIGSKSHYYYYSNHLDKIVRTKNGKEKVSFQFSENNDTIAKYIEIAHSNIQLKITLKSLN